MSTSSITAKYTQPKAYFPDFCHGSTVSASTRPDGLELLQHGMLMRLFNTENCSASSCSTSSEVSRKMSNARPARLANVSATAGIMIDNFRWLLVLEMAATLWRL